MSHESSTFIPSLKTEDLSLIFYFIYAYFFPLIYLPHVSKPISALSIRFLNFPKRTAHHIPLDLISRIKFVISTGQESSHYAYPLVTCCHVTLTAINSILQFEGPSLYYYPSN